MQQAMQTILALGMVAIQATHTILPMGHAPAPLAMGNAPAIQQPMHMILAMDMIAIRPDMGQAPAPLVTGHAPILPPKRIAPAPQQAVHQATHQTITVAEKANEVPDRDRLTRARMRNVPKQLLKLRCRGRIPAK